MERRNDDLLPDPKRSKTDYTEEELDDLISLDNIYLNPDIYKIGERTMVISPMKTGKTYCIDFLLDKLPENAIKLLITNRKSLARKACKDFGFKSYEHFGSVIENQNAIAITVNSLWKYKDIEKVHVIIWDEFRTTVDMLLSDIMRNYTNIVTIMEKLISQRNASDGTPRTVLFLDAMMSGREVRWIQNVIKEANGVDDIVLKQFTPNIEYSPFDTVETVGIDVLLRSMLLGVKQGKKYCYVTNCAQLSERLFGLIQCGCPELIEKLKLPYGRYDRIKFAFYSANQSNELQQLLDSEFKDIEFDVFGFSPVICTGESIEAVEFDEVFGIFCGTAGSVNSIAQMPGRARHNKSKRVRIAIIGNLHQDIPEFEEHVENYTTSVINNWSRFSKLQLPHEKQHNQTGLFKYFHNTSRWEINHQKIKDYINGMSNSSKTLLRDTWDMFRHSQNDFTSSLLDAFLLNHPDTKIIENASNARCKINNANLIRMANDTPKRVMFMEDCHGVRIKVASRILVLSVELGLFGFTKPVPNNTNDLVFKDSFYNAVNRLPSRVNIERMTQSLAIIENGIAWSQAMGFDSFNGLAPMSNEYTPRDFLKELFGLLQFRPTEYGCSVIPVGSEISCVLFFAFYDDFVKLFHKPCYNAWLKMLQVSLPVKSPKKLTSKIVKVIESGCVKVLKYFGYNYELMKDDNNNPVGTRPTEGKLTDYIKNFNADFSYDMGKTRVRIRVLGTCRKEHAHFNDVVLRNAANIILFRIGTFVRSSKLDYDILAEEQPAYANVIIAIKHFIELSREYMSGPCSWVYKDSEPLSIEVVNLFISYSKCFNPSQLNKSC